MAQSRIVLLHATPVAMAPVHVAFQALWPEAELVNLLDDGLTTDRAREANLSPAMIDRFVSFCRYGQNMAADGLLVTCSAFGPAIERAADELAIPVLKPNEAMFQAAIKKGNKIGMIATFAPSLSTMEEEFREEAQRMGSTAELTSLVVPEAMAALRKGDAATHDRLVSERGQQLNGFDAVMLAHFSTSQAAPALRALTGTPVLTAPESAVARMRQLVPGQATVVRGCGDAHRRGG